MHTHIIGDSLSFNNPPLGVNLQLLSEFSRWALLNNTANDTVTDMPTLTSTAETQSQNNRAIIIALGVTGGVIVLFIHVFAIVVIRRICCSKRRNKVMRWVDNVLVVIP